MKVSNNTPWLALFQSRIITVRSLFSLAGLVLLIIFTIISHYQLDRRLQKAEAAGQAIHYTERAEAAVLAGHFYGRLFELTGQDTYQQEASDAATRLESDLSALVQLSEKDWDELRGEVEKLRQAVEQHKQGSISEEVNIQPISTDNVPAQRFIYPVREATSSLHSLTTPISRIKTLLATTLVVRQAAVYRSKQTAWTLFLGTGTLALGIIAYAFGLVGREKQERLQTEQNLLELNINKDKFFSIVSHDLRGPTANIVKLSEFMQEDGLSADDYRTMATHLHKSAQNLHKLLENLLGWARLQMGRVDCRPETIDLHRLAEENIAQISPIAVDKNIALENEIPAGTLAFADEKMCDTVLRNLLLNAIKFTHAQGSVRIHAAESNGGIKLRVSDTGVGMTPEAMGRLFKLGCQATSKGTANEPGSGLGLILCKELVEKNKGQIDVASEPNKGSTFTVTLPKNVVGAASA